MGKKSKWTVVSEVPVDSNGTPSEPAPAEVPDTEAALADIERQTKEALADLEKVNLANKKKGYIEDLEHHKKYGPGVRAYDEALSAQGKTLREQIAKAKRELEMAKLGKANLNYKILVPAGAPPLRVRDTVLILTSEEVLRLLRALLTQERILRVGRNMASNQTPPSVKQDPDVADGTLMEYLIDCARECGHDLSNEYLGREGKPSEEE